MLTTQHLRLLLQEPKPAEDSNAPEAPKQPVKRGRKAKKDTAEPAADSPADAPSTTCTADDEEPKKKKTPTKNGKCLSFYDGSESHVR